VVALAGAVELVVAMLEAISERSSGGRRRSGDVLVVLPLCFGVGSVGAFFVGVFRGAAGSTGADGVGCGVDGLGALGVDPAGADGALGAVVGLDCGVGGPARLCGLVAAVVVRCRAVVVAVLVRPVTVAAVEVVRFVAAVVVRDPADLVTVPMVDAAAWGTVLATVVTAPPTT